MLARLALCPSVVAGDRRVVLLWGCGEGGNAGDGFRAGFPSRFRVKSLRISGLPGV
jgi:hypothetical protein